MNGTQHYVTIIFSIGFTYPPALHTHTHTDKMGAKVSVPGSEDSCGVSLTRQENQSLSFFSRYNSCYAAFEVNERMETDTRRPVSCVQCDSCAL